MSRDYFAILGLAPGRYEPGVITRQFEAQRDQVLARLGDADGGRSARHRLEQLHLAHATLRDPDAQQAYLEARFGDDDLRRLRLLIAASLEGGLLRYSRRREILAEAQRCGLSDFEAQLLIAEVQFGSDTPVVAPKRRTRRSNGAARAGLGLLAAACLGSAMLVGLIRWVSSS